MRYIPGTEFAVDTRVAISGCNDRKTERFLVGKRVKEFHALADAAAKALTRLQAAVILGDRGGHYSIRINVRSWVCFKWVPHVSAPAGTDALQVAGDAHDVEITDNH